jgi:hypothetical protein
VRVPDEERFLYLATTVKPGDWELYLADKVDLRYLFTYPPKALFFYFDLLDLKDGEVLMARFEESIPVEHIPGPQLFASDHTESVEFETSSDSVETLFIDGEWDLPEMGKFQQKISDVYTFMYTISDWNEAKNQQTKRDSIVKALLGKPFRGGSSYGSYFDDLEMRLERKNRLRLRSIQKASPGKIGISGLPEIFDSVQSLIENYAENRNMVKEKYYSLYSFLQKGELLRLSVRKYDPNDSRSAEMAKLTEALSAQLGVDFLSELRDICQKNPLITSKVLLALARRIMMAGEFFVQGRASFEQA